MLYEMGRAALDLEMTDRVYRTEYSVFGHDELIRRVTGRDNGPEAQRAFARAWDYCLSWNTLVSGDYLGPYKSSMGHAVYAKDGVDRSDNVHYAFADVQDVYAFDPAEKLPRLPHGELVRRFEADYRRCAARIPDAVAMTGVYITCMSGLIDMLGWNMLLLGAGYDPDAFGRLTDRYAAWAEPFFTALADADIPVVMVHDDIVWSSGAFIHPDWYRRFIFPHYKRFLSPLLDAGKKILFTSDGDYTEFIDDIAACGAHGFIMEPLTDMAAVAEKYGQTHVLIGNADTRVLLLGSREAIYREVARCMDIGRPCPGFIMAVGNHIPANTPVDNCLYYDECCKKLGRR